MPRVSIVLPTFNRVHLLRQTVPTLLAQTHQDLEILIADGASTDGTRSYVEQLGDPRVKLLPLDKPVPHFANWNRGLRAARGDLIALYHDDDLYDREIVARCVETFERNPNVGFVHVGARVFGDDGRDLGRRQAARRDYVRDGRNEALRWMAAVHDVVPSSTMVRRRVYDQIELFDPALYYADWDLYIRLALVTDVGYLAGPLIDVRHHGESVTSSLRPERFVREIELLLPRFERYLDSAKLTPIGGRERAFDGVRRDLARRLFRLHLSLVRRGEHSLASNLQDSMLQLDGRTATRAIVGLLARFNGPVGTRLLSSLHRLRNQSLSMPAGSRS